MKTKELKLSRIGNSRGVRIPADTLQRYHMGASVMEETACEMAASEEDWSDWDTVSADGMDATSATMWWCPI